MLRKLIDNLSQSTGTALVIGDECHSYPELLVEVERFYSWLMQRSKGEIIGLVMRNDLGSYAFLIACVLSHCGYVILNPAQPIDRNMLIAMDAGLKAFAGSRAEDKDLLSEAYSFISLQDIPPASALISLKAPAEDAPAYILFTSGSTGKPKGVRISTANLNAMLEAVQALPLPISREDRALQMFDLTFDGSVLMLFYPLCHGAAIYTIDATKIKYLEIARVMLSYSLSFVFLVPSVISLLKPYLPTLSFPAVKTLLVGAEAVSKTLLDCIMPCVPNAEVWNLYGPTEATVCVTAYKVDANVERELHHDILPIGKPLQGVLSLLVTEDGELCAKGEQGELYVGGAQLTDGYVNNDELNRNAFVTYMWEGKPQRFYATGDLAYLNEYGNYVYCGRKDRQVKVQGNRIELGEIEYHAKQVSGSNSVVVVDEEDGIAKLHLFVESATHSEAEIGKYLSGKLPSCMMPQQITLVESFPLTASDKTDVKRLQSEYMIKRENKDG